MASFNGAKLKATKVTCSKCKEKKFVNPIALEKRIAVYGSIEEIEKKWKCRTCMNEVKAEVENLAAEESRQKRMSDGDKKLKPTLNIYTGPAGADMDLI